MEASHGLGELPVEILPGVLSALSWRVGDLASCCRVSRLWRRFATPLLYVRLWLREQTRLMRAFATLAEHPELARHVRIIGACARGVRRR